MAQKRPKKRKDGQYHIHKFICTREDGSRYYEWFRGKNWAEVNTRANLFKMEYLAGLTKENKPSITLREAFDKYIETCRTLCKSEDFSHSTIPGYISIRDHAFQDIMDKPVDKITVDDVQSSIDSRINTPSKRTGKPLSIKTIRNEYYLLKPILDKYAPDINLKTIKLGKRKKKRPMVLENAEAPVILSEAYKLHPEFFLYTLITMITGMRPSEVYALRWRDLSAEPMVSLIDQQKLLYGEINVDKAKTMNELRVYEEKGTKTESGERVLTHDWSLFETIYSVRPRGEDDAPFLDMNPRQQQYYWDRLRDNLGLSKERRFYDLRHYHCSVMVAAGAPEDYIAADMGHSTIQMAHDVYVEIIGEKKADINLQVAQHTSSLIGLLNTTKDATTPQNLLSIV